LLASTSYTRDRPSGTQEEEEEEEEGEGTKKEGAREDVGEALCSFQVMISRLAKLAENLATSSALTPDCAIYVNFLCFSVAPQFLHLN
jgi:hypothetical protein